MSASTLARAAAIKGDPRWAAIRARDASAGSTFFYSVKTTGVYCRPSCAARLARPENIAFHSTAAAAEKAGFRACRRCKPDQPSLVERRSAPVEKPCRLIQRREGVPGLGKAA